MANRALFDSAPKGKMVPPATTTNAAGGVAYKMSDQHALAQYAATGCFRGTFYAKDTEQLTKVLELAGKCSSEFIAKTACWSRKHGFLKDMPALLCCILAARGDDESRALLTSIFPRVIDNGKMFMNFAQITRSGVTGRKSFGYRSKKLMQQFLNGHDCDWLFRNSIGQKPSMGDIIKMVRPKAWDAQHEALFGYFIGKDLNGKAEALPSLVQAFEAWKQNRDQEPPKVPFQMLTAQKLSTDQWAKIIRDGAWHFTRMNLNTAMRHEVFEKHPDLIEVVAARLADADTIRKSRVFPYQLLATYKAVYENAPRKIVDALHDALEVSVENVPKIDGKVVIVVDVSGSMAQPVTGRGMYRAHTTEVSCVDVAALFASAILRTNPDAVVLPVDHEAHGDFVMEPRDSVMTNTRRLAEYCGGGTALGAAMTWINQEKIDPDVVIFISDNESWNDRTDDGWGRRQGTSVMQGFKALQSRKPKAKLVNIDIVPNATAQTAEGDPATLNIGGFSDRVFTVVDSFLHERAEKWVDTITHCVV